MSNVTALPGVQPQAVVNDEAITLIERLLDRLKSGEIVGVAYATVKPNGTGTTAWNCPSHMGNHLFAGIHRVAYEMMRSSDD